MMMVVFFISVAVVFGVAMGWHWMDQIMCGMVVLTKRSHPSVEKSVPETVHSHFSNRDFVRDNLSNHFVPQPILA